MDNAATVTCPRCLGTKIQKEREISISSITGNWLDKLDKGKCEFCGGTGIVAVSYNEVDKD